MVVDHPLVKFRTEVDRSAAYAAYYVAKNIVAAGLADKCQVEFAYAIGVAKPISVLVDAFRTGKVSDDKPEEAVIKVFDLRSTAIIRALDLASRFTVPCPLTVTWGVMPSVLLGKSKRMDAMKAALN